MVVISHKPIEQLYQETIAQAEIPSVTDRQDLLDKYLVRQLVISLDEVLNTVAAQPAKYAQVQVYADILRISQDIQLEKLTLLIVARKIEVVDSCTIQISEKSQGLLIFAQELAGTLQFASMDSPQTVQWTLNQIPAKSVGLEVYVEQGQVAHTLTARIKNDMVRWLRPLRLLLTTQFQLAAALFTTHPIETQALLDWIIFITRGATEASDLHKQSEALLARSLLTSSTTIFVPALSLNAYEREVQALFTSVKAYDVQYERFTDRQISLAEHQAMVRLMIQHNKATIDAHKQLIALADQTLKQASASAEQAKVKYKAQQSQVKSAQIHFEYGMEVWQSDQYWAAVSKMFLAIGDFAFSVGAAIASGGAGTAEAIESGFNALNALVTLIGEVDSIAQQMQQVLESMEQLDKLNKQIDALIASLYAIAQQNPSTELALPATGPSEGDLISGQVEWDAFQAATAVFLQQPLNIPIEGAAEYKLELDKLAIYGKAYLAAQAAVIKAAQELLQLQIQAQVSQSQQQPLQDYLQMTVEQEETYKAVLQLLFQQRLNMKCWLFLAVQNLVWAYQYETLTEKEPVPTITTPALQLEEILASLVRKHNTIRESLNPPPQSAQTRQIITALEVPLSAYDGVVAALQQRGSATITITLDEQAFRGMERVRVTKWRCVAQGVSIPQGRRISFTLESSGVLMDRWQGQTYQFAAMPSIRKFVYENAYPDTPQTITDEVLNVQHAIMVDGTVAEEQKTNYYRPTPFTQWTLKLDDTQGIIDLSTLQSLKLIWFVDAVITNPTR